MAVGTSRLAASEYCWNGATVVRCTAEQRLLEMFEGHVSLPALKPAATDL